jgi:hypothetical protein
MRRKKITTEYTEVQGGNAEIFLDSLPLWLIA